MRRGEVHPEKIRLDARIFGRLAKRGIFFVITLALLLVTPLSFAAGQSPQEMLSVGRVDEALATLQQQMQVSASADTYNLLCRAHFQLSEWDTGISFCEKAVSLAPDNGLYHLWLGRIYGEKADHTNFVKATGLARKVRTEFERAVALSPSNWQARTDLAEYYLEAPGILGGGEDKARAQAELIAPLDPPTAHWVKGRIAEKDQDDAAAEREFRAAVDSSNGGVRAWLNLAGFYRHQNRFPEMDEALAKLESSPLDHPAALVDGAGMLLRSGRNYRVGMKLLRRYLASTMVEEAPAFKAHYLLGQLLEKQGDRGGAAEEYRAALAMAHSFRPAQEGLKRVGN